MQHFRPGQSETPGIRSLSQLQPDITATRLMFLQMKQDGRKPLARKTDLSAEEASFQEVEFGCQEEGRRAASIYFSTSLLAVE